MSYGTLVWADTSNLNTVPNGVEQDIETIFGWYKHGAESSFGFNSVVHGREDHCLGDNGKCSSSFINLFVNDVFVV